jgi:hypothetical protein
MEPDIPDNTEAAVWYLASLDDDCVLGIVFVKSDGSMLMSRSRTVDTDFQKEFNFQSSKKLKSIPWRLKVPCSKCIIM